jgi:hypothetical protein
MTQRKKRLPERLKEREKIPLLPLPWYGNIFLSFLDRGITPCPLP